MRMFALATVLALAATAPAADPPSKAEVDGLIDQGQAWLLAQQQPDGAFLPGNRFVVGVTAMAVEALAKPPHALPADDARMMKAIAWLKGKTQPDGGVYDPAEGLGTYGTSFTLMAAAAAKVDDKAWIEGMQKYLKDEQNIDPKSSHDGGIGYGSGGKGDEDLSNTSSAVQALRASGVPADDPALQRAIKFLQRCQNLSSVNDQAWAKNDGSAVYSPDESKAEGSQPEKPAAKPGADGKPGTNGGNGGAGGDGGTAKATMDGYGSMTYALISSYLALDLKADDPRVKAALDWVSHNYRFDANPGLQPGHEHEGLLYYYAAMARTFGLLDQKTVTLPDGASKDWRGDLFAAIKASAKPGEHGTMWMNDAKRWGEGMPHLATLYCLRALKTIGATLQ